jgi:hypothetical protein
MIETKLTVGLVLERFALPGPWGGFQWRPAAVFPEPPETAAWTFLGASGSAMSYYAGAYDVHLYSTDTANYRDNLEASTPKLWVVMRPEGPEPPVEIVAITADPAEGEASTEAGSNAVETIAMPPEIAGAIAEFFAVHHVERPIIKRRRDRAEPDIRLRGEQPAGNSVPEKKAAGDRE